MSHKRCLNEPSVSEEACATESRLVMALHGGLPSSFFPMIDDGHSYTDWPTDSILPHVGRQDTLITTTKDATTNRPQGTEYVNLIILCVCFSIHCIKGLPIAHLLVFSSLYIRPNMPEIFRVVDKYQALVASTLTTIGEGHDLLVEKLPFSFKSAADILAIQAELSSEDNGYKEDGFKTMRITHKTKGYMDLTCYMGGRCK